MPSPDMSFAPFRCTHPPPPDLPLLPTQNLFPKDIAGYNIIKLKVSQCIYASLVDKRAHKGAHIPREPPPAAVYYWCFDNKLGLIGQY